MKTTFIHHSCFLVETDGCYYLFDYEKGSLPQLNTAKPIYVLASHGHYDHYNSQVFSILEDLGIEKIQGILSDDIEIPENKNVLQVSAGNEYDLGEHQKLTTFQSTDLGVAFLIEDHEKLIYHAGDLNDWVWEEESASYNEQMTKDYRNQIEILSEKLNHREIDVAFVVLDPRQERDYARGMKYFLEHIPVKKVYPMHYWGDAKIIQQFLNDYPEYQVQIQRTE